MAKTHYQLLAIAPDADLGGIQAATRRAIDDIKQAHRILTNPTLRAACDAAEQQRYCELLEVDAITDNVILNAAAKHTASALRNAFQVLSDPAQRQHYDAGLALPDLMPAAKSFPTSPTPAAVLTVSAEPVASGYLSLLAFGLTLTAVMVGPQLLGRRDSSLNLLVFLALLLMCGLLAVILRLPQKIFLRRRARFFNAGSAFCWSAALLPALWLIYQTDMSLPTDKDPLLRLVATVIGAALALVAGLLGGPLQASLHGCYWPLRCLITGTLTMLLLALLAADVWLLLRWQQGAGLPF